MSSHVEAQLKRKHAEAMCRATVEALRAFRWPKLTDPKTVVRANAEERHAGLLERLEFWRAELVKARAVEVEAAQQ